MNAIKDRVEDIMGDLKDRFKNPLILSFILVWLYFHWRFIYELVTVNNEIAVGIRGDYFKQYIINQGWCKMVGLPLLFAFISLISFYLVGIIAQFIKLWLGKRLAAEIMYRYDRGKYELKAVTDRIKKENRELKAKEENLIEENETYKSKLRVKDSELEKANEIRSNLAEAKDREIGDLKALNMELGKEKEEVELQLALSAAQNMQFKNDVEELQRKLTELHTSQQQVLDEKDNEIERHKAIGRDALEETHTNKEHFKKSVTENLDLKAQINQLQKELKEKQSLIESQKKELASIELSKKLYEVVADAKDKASKNFKLNEGKQTLLTTDELLLLFELFGHSKWKIKNLPKGDVEFFTYENGTFKFSNFASQIYEPRFDQGHLTFFRAFLSSDRRYKTELDVSHPNIFTGTEQKPGKQSPESVVYEKLVD